MASSRARDLDGADSVGALAFANTNGTQYVFLANGQLNYVQDTNGNRITLGHDTQNRLTSLTYANPSDPSEPAEQLTLTYNPQGFVSQLVDGTGDLWAYNYDTAGNHRRHSSEHGYRLWLAYICHERELYALPQCKEPCGRAFIG